MFRRAFTVLFLLLGLGLVSLSAQVLPSGGNLPAGLLSGLAGSQRQIPSISNFPYSGLQNPFGLRGSGAASIFSRPDGLVPDGTNFLDGLEPVRRNEFQIFVEGTTGLRLPMFGQNLFKGAPRTFAPAENIPVTQNYVVGPGDEVMIRAWGQVSINLWLLVDRNGAIDIPQVGVVQVSGLKAQELTGFLKAQVGRVFKNFEMNVTLGRLRSIQVLLVGHVRRPGNYSISASSTLINALFSSGGPSEVGSMRRIQLKRDNKLVAEFDLYDLISKGDKSKDMKLLNGDVIHVLPMGSLVAVAGSVQMPAVYELKNGESADDILAYAGGLSATGSPKRVVLKRIGDDSKRIVSELDLDKQGGEIKLQNGDVVQMFSISPRIGSAVTLRGNVAEPRTIPWTEGMRISELIPDKHVLMPRLYWMNKNERGQSKDLYDRNSPLSFEASDGRFGTGARDDRFDANQARERQLKELTGSESLDAEALRNEIKKSLYEVNWNYATIERFNQETFVTSLITFQLGKAILADDPEQNKILQSGDVVTIFSKDDIRIPISQQTQYVHLEGEFINPGLYQIRTGETLRDLTKRVGGFSPHAYLYGAVFTRESTRKEQQQRQDEALLRLEQELRHAHARLQGEALDVAEAAAAGNQVEGRYAMIQSMRRVPATGRIVLELNPRSSIPEDLSDIQLEDGDRFVVPSRPAEVYVMGEVYNQQSRLWNSRDSLTHYLDQAGGATRNADSKYMYIIRADGSVYSRDYAGRSFAKARLYPGDTIVVPEKLDYSTWKKELKDWAQIASQVAMGAAAIKVLSRD